MTMKDDSFYIKEFMDLHRNLSIPELFSPERMLVGFCCFRTGYELAAKRLLREHRTEIAFAETEEQASKDYSANTEQKSLAPKQKKSRKEAEETAQIDHKQYF